MITQHTMQMFQTLIERKIERKIERSSVAFVVPVSLDNLVKARIRARECAGFNGLPSRA